MRRLFLIVSSMALAAETVPAAEPTVCTVPH